MSKPRGVENSELDGDIQPELEDEIYLSGSFAFMPGLLEQWRVPGASITVVDGDRTESEGFGMAELGLTFFDSWTLCYAGDTSHAHVAALLALMIESGHYTDDKLRPLSWQTPICCLIREDFVLRDPWATDHTTLENIMHHQTGIARHSNAYMRYTRPDGFLGSRRVVTPRDIVRKLRYLPMAEDSGPFYRYSNLMFATLSHVIEKLTGQSLGDALRIGLWQPLRMTNTYLRLQDALDSGRNVARGYFWDTKKGEYIALPRITTEDLTGSGAVITSAEDLAKWIRFWLREEAPLSPAAHQTLRLGQIVYGDGGDAVPYGMPRLHAKGWRMLSYRGHRFWSHHGRVDAFGALVTFSPDLDFGVAVMGNTAFTSSAVAAIATLHLVEEKLGVPPAERKDWATKFQLIMQDVENYVRGGLDTLYPNRRAHPTLPPSVPLSKYAGVYYNQGYGYIMLTVVRTSDTESPANSQPQLSADLPDSRFHVKGDLVHVSGEEWFMYVDSKDAPILTMHDFAAVKFEIGRNGKAMSMGIEWRNRDLVDGWIWYARVALRERPARATA